MTKATYSSRDIRYSTEDTAPRTYVTLWGGTTSRDSYTTFLELGIRVAQYEGTAATADSSDRR